MLLFVVCFVILSLVISVCSIKSAFDSDLGQVRRDLSDALVQLDVSSTLLREALAAKQNATAANMARDLEGVQARLDHMQNQLLPKVLNGRHQATLYNIWKQIPFSCR